MQRVALSFSRAVLYTAIGIANLTPAIAQIPSPPQPIEHPTVVLGQVTNAHANEMPSITAAVEDLNKVLASAEFKREVLALHVGQMKDSSGQEQTGEQVYRSLVTHSPFTVKVSMISYKASWIMRNLIWKTEGLEDDNFPDTCFVNRHFFQRQDD